MTFVHVIQLTAIGLAVCVVAPSPVLVLWLVLEKRTESITFVRHAWRYLMRFKRWPFVRTFFGFGLGSRILLLFMLAIGFLILRFLWAADQGYDFRVGGLDVTQIDWLKRYNHDWLHGGSYVPNILAAITGFLIGAPVAAVFLASFTVEREERVALERVNTLSLIAWRTYRNAVFAFCNGERVEALRRDVPRLLKMYGDIIQIYNDIMTDIWSPIRETPSDSNVQNARLATIRGMLDPLRVLANSLIPTIGLSETVESEWSAVVGAWNTLDQYVRLQRIERDLEWFDTFVDARMRRWLSRPINPLQEFTNIHGSVIRSPWSPSTMIDSVAALTRFSTDTSYRYQLPPIGAYQTYYQAARDFINGLLNDVDIVELSGWPETETEATRDAGPRWLVSVRSPDTVEQRIADAEQLRSQMRSMGGFKRKSSKRWLSGSAISRSLWGAERGE